MKYKALPTRFSSVESGWSSGPPLMCETTPLEKGVLGTPDTTKNVVVVTIQNVLNTVAAEIGLPNSGKDMIPLAFKPGDARKMCIELLLHLGHMGDEIARDLCEKLPDIVAKYKDDV